MTPTRSTTTGPADQTTGTAPEEPPAEHVSDTVERIVEAAGRCFYRDGIYPTGVDALAGEAGVSKRTLYNHFPSKDAVIAAYLRQREAQWLDKLEHLWATLGDDPVARVAAYVRGYARPVADELFRGSAFINAAAELADDEHEALTVIQHSLADMERGIASILAGAGCPAEVAEELGRRILVVIEGAVAVGGARRDQAPLSLAEQMITEMVQDALARP